MMNFKTRLRFKWQVYVSPIENLPLFCGLFWFLAGIDPVTGLFLDKNCSRYSKDVEGSKGVSLWLPLLSKQELIQLD